MTTAAVTAAPQLSILNVGGIPATLTAGDLVALDGLEITWGRPTVLERAKAATLRARVFDASHPSTFAARTDLIGRTVTASYTRDGLGYDGSQFYGRITDVEAHPATVAGRAGLLVELAASSIEVDLANAILPEGTTWPVETIATRRDRIMALFPVGVPRAVETHPAWDGHQCHAVDVGGKDLYALLRALYDSISVYPMVYRPTALGGKFTYAGRRFVTGATALAGLAQRPVLGGAWLATSTVPTAASGTLAVHTRDLPADAIEDVTLTRSVDTALTRVEVKWSDLATGDQLAVGAVPGFDESAVGRRALTIETWHGTGPGAVAALNDWVSLCTYEAAAPAVGPVRFHSDLNGGGFETVEQADLLLACAEQTVGASLLRGSWLTRAGIRPVFGIIGGKVAFSRGQWLIEANLAAWGTDTPPRPLPIKYASSPAAGVRLRDCDPSLTFGDLATVSVGAGYTTATQPAY